MIPHHRMIGVNGVAGSGVVLVVALVFCQRVKDRIVQPAKTECRSQFVALGRVIENHVQNYFDTSLVKRPDHFLELQFLLAQ